MLSEEHSHFLTEQAQRAQLVAEQGNQPNQAPLTLVVFSNTCPSAGCNLAIRGGQSMPSERNERVR